MYALLSSIVVSFLKFLQSHRYFFTVIPKMFKLSFLFLFSPSNPPNSPFSSLCYNPLPEPIEKYF